ncbi:MAG: YibE/F family protein, partial [Cellulosilyticaceae bacterium]
AGFQDLNLTLIYQASIYLACSGAMVDLSIDISAAIEEVIDKKPDITRKEILLSGMNIGKSVVGTQATTLLLAYMGSFIAVMMVYMAQGTPLLNILNSKSIASEVLHTFVGCIGLVIVSPLTAVICSRVYKDNGVK